MVSISVFAGTSPRVQRTVGPFSEPPGRLWKSGKLRFSILGDTRTNANEWAKVAAAVGKEKDLAFIGFVGDFVDDGRNWDSWDTQFFKPAGDLFSRVPILPVVGNHENGTPMIDAMFWTPGEKGTDRNWVQDCGPVRLIGIDGAQDWSAGSANVKWLEKRLAESHHKFLFLMEHYPAWTSSKHGKLGPAGTPIEKPILQAQQVIMPLLAKYHATAMLAGHDHVYERSEPEGSVTMIIAGAAGAPLYEKSKEAAEQNPWSKVFASKYHYTVFEVDGEQCVMKALTPAGEQLDTRTWKARKEAESGNGNPVGSSR